MATATAITTLSLFFPKPKLPLRPRRILFSSKSTTCTSCSSSSSINYGVAGLLGSGLALLGGPASAFVLPLLGQLSEPSNGLSLPTWAVHVSSVVEWITAMVLVWQYGEKSGFQSWKGLSWGMVPLLGGAFCACTWHFFYNAESLEVLVAIQAALTVIGNAIHTLKPKVCSFFEGSVPSPSCNRNCFSGLGGLHRLNHTKENPVRRSVAVG